MFHIASYLTFLSNYVVLCLPNPYKCWWWQVVFTVRYMFVTRNINSFLLSFFFKYRNGTEMGDTPPPPLPSSFTIYIQVPLLVFRKPISEHQERNLSGCKKYPPFFHIAYIIGDSPKDISSLYRNSRFNIPGTEILLFMMALKTGLKNVIG